VRIRRIIKSTAFRFALLHTLVFVISVSVIGWVAEVMVTSALERQARDRVETETASLMTEYQRHGLTGLRSTIEERSSSAKRRLQYGIVDSQGLAIVGDRYLGEFATTSTTAVQPIHRHNGESANDNILIASRPLDGDLRLVIADNLESVEDVENVVLNGFLVALALAIALGLGAGMLFTRSLLRRVDGVTRTAEAIIRGDLSQRVALTGSGDDFDRLSATLNTMLDKIADLLENLRQVSNDIAHDLRTPLARLRQQLEDVRNHTSAPSDYERTIDRAIVEADALLDTFSALLRIAQIEAGARRSSFRKVDLSDVMRTVAEAYGAVLEESCRVLKTDIPQTFTISGDRELLIQLFSNLIENALRHTPKETTVVMRLFHADAHACAEISDNGPGIPEGERSRVLRRFYRLEHSRTTPGNGLGLSLVAAIADVHQAKVELSHNKPGLKITIRFPRAAAAFQKQAQSQSPSSG
jgi:signal transduction histidine kinase